MQNIPFPQLCNCTHVVISGGRDTRVGGQQWKPGLWSQGWACPEPSQAAGSHLLGFEPIFFSPLKYLVLHAERVPRHSGFALVTVVRHSQESRKLTQGAARCWGLVVVNTLLKEQ